jgi:hypothetical protein
MAKNGDYPFVVNVWNRFSPKAKKEDEVVLCVTFNHYPNGNRPVQELISGKRAEPTNHNMYEIRAGDMLAFPLFWMQEAETNMIGETLDICISPKYKQPKPNEAYYLWLGSKARYTPTNFPDHKDHIKASNGFSREYAGLWKFENPTAAKPWQLKVEKLLPDPESDDVSAGPDIP